MALAMVRATVPMTVPMMEPEKALAWVRVMVPMTALAKGQRTASDLAPRCNQVEGALARLLGQRKAPAWDSALDLE